MSMPVRSRSLAEIAAAFVANSAGLALRSGPVLVLAADDQPALRGRAEVEIGVRRLPRQEIVEPRRARQQRPATPPPAAPGWRWPRRPTPAPPSGRYRSGRAVRRAADGRRRCRRRGGPRPRSAGRARPCRRRRDTAHDCAACRIRSAAAGPGSPDPPPPAPSAATRARPARARPVWRIGRDSGTSISCWIIAVEAGVDPRTARRAGRASDRPAG